MKKKTENLAWLVLTLSLFVCITLSVGIPLAVRGFVLNSTRAMNIELHAQEGTVTYQARGSDTRVVVESGHQADVRARSLVQMNEEGQALLLFYHPDQAEIPISTIQLRGKTDLAIGNIRTPRFPVSPLPHLIELQADQAHKMQVSLAGNGRHAELMAQTPHGLITLEEGSFAFVIEQLLTEFSVNVGRARVTDPSTDRPLVLVAPQRTQMTQEGLGGIYVGETDILRNRNGNFEEPNLEHWVTITDTGDPQESGGTVRQAKLGDRNSVVFFDRHGQSHAETRIKQELSRDIRSAESLRVQARVLVGVQTLSVCGSLGTECPMMIRIEFTDEAGGTLHEWLQGFYVLDGDNQDVCISCRWKAQHIKIPAFNVWWDYESEDLLPLLREQGIRPAVLQRVEIYASGWTYGSAIDRIAILVGD